MKNEYAKNSLDGVWVGDCIGNIGQLYNVGDILKALDAGIVKFGDQLNRFHSQFQYSDDTEEAIVLYNHWINNKCIDQDKLALEFATRYYTRDPDGEIYGYGLNTRKVLKDIYDGVPWNTANKFIKKSEGMPSHIDSLVGSLSNGKSFKAAIHEVNLVLEKQKQNEVGKELVGSCGNGSAMRIAPLGAFLGEDDSITPEKVVELATLQSQPTHCHPEGIAGAVAIALAGAFITRLHKHDELGVNGCNMLNKIIEFVPDGEVKNGLIKANNLPFDTPIDKAIQILGNGTHVTCQDTVPFCCWITAKYLKQYPTNKDIYEDAIIETSRAFGDVDTNCAIVGGLIGIISPPPQKWVNFCSPMDGVCYEYL